MAFPLKVQVHDRIKSILVNWRIKRQRTVRILQECARKIGDCHVEKANNDVSSSGMSLTSSVLGLAGVILAPATAGGSLALTAAATGTGVASIAQSYLSEGKFKELVEEQLKSANEAIEEDRKETGHLIDIVQPLLNAANALPREKVERILQTVFKVSFSDFVSRRHILHSPAVAASKTVLTVAGGAHAYATSSNALRQVTKQTSMVGKASHGSLAGQTGTALVTTKSFKITQKQTTVVGRGISKFGVAVGLITIPLDFYSMLEASDRGKSELESELQKKASDLEDEMLSLEEQISGTPIMYEELKNILGNLSESEYFQSDDDIRAFTKYAKENLQKFCTGIKVY